MRTYYENTITSSIKEITNKIGLGVVVQAKPVILATGGRGESGANA